MPTEYLVATANHCETVTADRFSKDDRGDAYFYDAGQADPVAHVPAESLEAIIDTRNRRE